jgi:glucose-6-phosphate dehydrogenase assembly protein OpcA
MTASVSPEQILKELSALWVSLGKSESAGMLRACSMTLLIAADEEEESSVLGEMVAEIMHQHPSRTIVLRVRDGDDPRIESNVTAQCWMPFGRRQQICCEQIELHSSEGALHELPRIVLGIMAPDLPVVVICRTPTIFALPGFEPLLNLTNRVIVDSRRSCRLPAAETLQHIARRRAEGHDVHDLAWTALTEWRESIAHAFEDPQLLAQLKAIDRITITRGQRCSDSEVWYLAAWLLRGIGPQARIGYRDDSAQGLHGVELAGADVSIQFTRGPGAVLQVVYGDVATSMPFAVSSDWNLLHQELSIMGRDRIYAEVLPKAIALAGG